MTDDVIVTIEISEEGDETEIGLTRLESRAVALWLASSRQRIDDVYEGFMGGAIA